MKESARSEAGTRVGRASGPEAASEQKVVVGLGELLWDLLPEGARLGGAPANFAAMAGRLGDRAIIASRVGIDALAREARETLETLPVELGWLQTDPELPTGTVTVSLEEGEPTYTIHEPVAWDALALTGEWRELAREADAVCFGTLAQRSRRARETILGFLEETRSDCVRIFDVNLRPPYASRQVLRDSLEQATIVKLNATELRQVLAEVCAEEPASGVEEEVLAGARLLLEESPVQMVCVTLGARGSLLVTRREHHRHPGLASQVRDTVGAGDAFTAALAHYYLEGATMAVLNEAGNRWGAWMASQCGAMPPVPAETLEAMAGEIGRSQRKASMKAAKGQHEGSERPA
jgi:fructokinase